jgi:hypothetical protein
MMKSLFLIVFTSLFIYITNVSAEGGLSVSTRSHDTNSEERYEDEYYGNEYYGDDIGVEVIWAGGITGAVPVRRYDRRQDRREVAPRRR